MDLLVHISVYMDVALPYMYVCPIEWIRVQVTENLKEVSCRLQHIDSPFLRVSHPVRSNQTQAESAWHLKEACTMAPASGEVPRT